MAKSRAFSAPGKALLAGGYLVLDPKYRSYVVALSSRMHSVVTQNDSKDKSKIRVTVLSSQFNEDCWCYELSEADNYKPVEVNGLRNPFVEKTLVNVLNYFQPKSDMTPNIFIEIYSDSGYHSQEGSVPRRNSFKQFNFHKNTITQVPKTGLGSSAGLVTVLSAGLISCFKPDLDVISQDHLTLIHNIAQVSHCQAQGKVGSGFDVAAATFGSILYQRFAPELINNLPPADSGEYHDSLVKSVDEIDWKITNERIKLPPGLRLVMGDVNNGSETTKLVAKVNEWYAKNYPRSLEVYTKINDGNMDFIAGLSKLNMLVLESPKEYKKMIDILDEGGDILKIPEFAQIQSAIGQVRECFRLITNESGADIEPQVQTELLNNSLKLNGVLTGIVPGAGGYDAISLIATELADLPSQTANDPRFSKVTWLDLQQQDLGVIEEQPLHYAGLK